MESQELYVITRSEEHADYVEKVFTDECKAIAYCLQFKADKNRYQRDMTTVKLTEDNEPIPITGEILKGIGFLEDDNKDWYYKGKITICYWKTIDKYHVVIDNPIPNVNKSYRDEYTISFLHELIRAMQMSGIDVKQLLKP
jgi:hypothetical protein